MKKRVSISNTITGGVFSKEFGDQSKLDSWVAYMEGLALKGEGWGWGERHLLKVKLPAELSGLVEEEYTSGNDVYCRLRPEYVITPVDITAEHEAELLAIEERKTDIEQAKLAISLINNDSDLKPYLKKVLIRLIKELRE